MNLRHCHAELSWGEVDQGRQAMRGSIDEIATSVQRAFIMVLFVTSSSQGIDANMKSA